MLLLCFCRICNGWWISRHILLNIFSTGMDSCLLSSCSSTRTTAARIMNGDSISLLTQSRTGICPMRTISLPVSPIMRWLLNGMIHCWTIFFSLIVKLSRSLGNAVLRCTNGPLKRTPISCPWILSSVSLEKKRNRCKKWEKVNIWVHQVHTISFGRWAVITVFKNLEVLPIFKAQIANIIYFLGDIHRILFLRL